METPNTIGTTVINIDHWYTPSVMSLPLQPWPRGGHVGATWFGTFDGGFHRENDGSIHGSSWWLFMDLPFGKLTQFAIENDQAEIVDLLIYPWNTWWFSIVNCKPLPGRVGSRVWSWMIKRGQTYGKMLWNGAAVWRIDYRHWLWKDGSLLQNEKPRLGLGIV